MNAPPGQFLFSQIRTTIFWLCLNAVDQDNVGFMTVEGQPPCSTACGSNVYDAGDSYMYWTLETNVEKIDGVNTVDGRNPAPVDR